MKTVAGNKCDCGVCAMLAETRRKPAKQAAKPTQQIADREMLIRLAETTKPSYLPALSPLHETFRNNVWGRGAFRDTLLPGSWR